MDNTKPEYISVAERLYYEMNANTKMDVPSIVYETVERWYREWQKQGSTMLFYDWCKKEKQPKTTNG